MFDEAGEVDDPTWWSWWHPPAPDADPADQATWEAHPAFGDWITADYLASQLKQLPTAEFKRLHLAAWVSNRDVWIEPHQFDLIGEAEPLTLDDAPVLAIDGSWSADASAIAASTADGRIELLEIQEKPIDAADGWRINIPELLAALQAHAERLLPRAIMYDKYLLGPQMLALGDEGLPVVEFPQSARRMVPATKRFADQLLDGNLKIVENANAPALQCVSTRSPRRMSGRPIWPMASQWATSSSANRSAASSASCCRPDTVELSAIAARTPFMALMGSTAVGRASRRVLWTRSTCHRNSPSRDPRKARTPWASPYAAVAPMAPAPRTVILAMASAVS